MKNPILAIALITAVVLFALSMTGCDNGTTTDPTTYTVTFNANGGTPTPETQTVEEGKKATEPTGVTKGTDTLDGWYKEANFTTKWNFATDTVTANLTLYAKWTPAGTTDNECECPNGTVHTDAECGCNADDCTCTYEPATQNQAPTANAGTDFEHNITTSGTTITLNGSGTDTDGTITAYAWTCTDKPASATAPTFSNSAIANPTVSGFDTLGDYEFSLKVKDNENKESTADVVKVSLCMTATKNVTASFTAFVAGETIDLTPTYTPVISGNGFEDSDVVYTVTDDKEHTWNKTTGYVVNVEPYNQPSSITFTQVFEMNGVTIKQQEIKASVPLFGDKTFSTLFDDEDQVISAIPSIAITLSKKVSAGAIPQYETITKDVTVSFPAVSFPGQSLDLSPTYTPTGGWGTHFSTADITYTLEDDSEPKNVWNSGTGFVVSRTPYANFSNPVFTQIFTLSDGTEIKRQSVTISVGNTATGFSSVPGGSIPSVSLTLSKEVEE